MTNEVVMAKKRALITGISGQDGSYLTELLLSKGYEVHGIVRRSSDGMGNRLSGLVAANQLCGNQLFLHDADLDDITTIRRIFNQVEASEIYHLAGQSHVGMSFDIPESTCEFTAMGTLRLLEILRDLPAPPRFLNIGSSEIFGRPDVTPQNEKTPTNPVTPYGVAKAFAVQIARVYRQSYGLFVCNAICFNHESPRRGLSFVTRKITRAVARIKLGLQDKLSLGDLNACRDWGFAGDYVRGMWMILQQDRPDDYIMATGRSTSIRELLSLAFGRVGLDWTKYVVVDQNLVRPADSQVLVGDASHARSVLGWSPEVDLPRLIEMMVDADLQDVTSSQHAVDDAGHVR